jgi:hypothetical protein
MREHVDKDELRDGGQQRAIIRKLVPWSILNCLSFIPAGNEAYEIGARTKADYRPLFSTRQLVVEVDMTPALEIALLNDAANEKEQIYESL